MCIKIAEKEEESGYIDPFTLFHLIIFHKDTETNFIKSFQNYF